MAVGRRCLRVLRAGLEGGRRWSAACRRTSCRRPRPSPSGSSSAWADGTVWPHFVTTMVEVLLGFAVGAALALVVGYGLARSALFERLASPYLVAAQAIPILALAPLLVLWFGPGLGSKVVICALIVFFPVAIATMVGIRSVDARLLELGRSLRATPPPGPDHARDPGRPAEHLRRPAGRRDPRGRRRDRRRVGRREQGPGRPHQPRPRVAVRHPADVRDAADDRPRRASRSTSSSSSSSAGSSVSASPSPSPVGGPRVVIASHAHRALAVVLACSPSLRSSPPAARAPARRPRRRRPPAVADPAATERRPTPA